MGYIRDEVLRAAAAVSVSVRELSATDGAKVRGIVQHRYLKGRSDCWPWEQWQVEYFAVCDPLAWSWIDEFIDGHRSIVFFNRGDDETTFEFASGADLVAVYGECFGFEFYVTDPEQSFVLCFNHHDCLFAVGPGAADWLQTRAPSGEGGRFTPSE